MLCQFLLYSKVNQPYIFYIPSFFGLTSHSGHTVYTEPSKSERENQTSLLMHICGIQENGTDDLICKVETETQMQRTNVWVLRMKEGGGRNWETGIETYALLILCIKQSELLELQLEAFSLLLPHICLQQMPELRTTLGRLYT